MFIYSHHCSRLWEKKNWLGGARNESFESDGAKSATLIPIPRKEHISLTNRLWEWKHARNYELGQTGMKPHDTQINLCNLLEYKTTNKLATAQLIKKNWGAALTPAHLRRLLSSMLGSLLKAKPILSLLIGKAEISNTFWLSKYINKQSQEEGRQSIPT